MGGCGVGAIDKRVVHVFMVRTYAVAEALLFQTVAVLHASPFLSGARFNVVVAAHFYENILNNPSIRSRSYSGRRERRRR